MPPEALVHDRRRADLAFTVDGTDCAAWHFTGSGTAPRPCVVMAHGFAMVRDARLAAYAERFAAAGYDVVVFDYRGFGDSAGEPRQWMDVPRQLEDWRAAIAFARDLDGVDPERIVLWGTSFSGGHVAALAAGDHRIAAVISQVPFSGLGGATGSRRLGHQLALVRAALADRIAGAMGRGPRYIPIVAEPPQFAAFDLRGARAQLGQLMDPGTTWQNRFTPRVLLQMGTYRPFEAAAEIRCPWLVVVCDPDTITPAQTAVDRSAPAPDVTVHHHPYAHFEVYRGEPFERMVADQVAFLGERLPG